jgi:hypothetical protein
LGARFSDIKYGAGAGRLRAHTYIQLLLFALSSDWLQFSVRLLFAQPMQERSTWAPVFQTVNVVQEQKCFGLILWFLMMMMVVVMVMV